MEQDFYSYNHHSRFNNFEQEFDEHELPDFEQNQRDNLTLEPLKKCFNIDQELDEHELPDFEQNQREPTAPTNKNLADFDTSKSDGSSAEIPPTVSAAPALTALFSASQSMIDEGAED
jgi:hypothetical protein